MNDVMIGKEASSGSLSSILNVVGPEKNA